MKRKRLTKSLRGWDECQGPSVFCQHWKGGAVLKTTKRNLRELSDAKQDRRCDELVQKVKLGLDMTGSALQELKDDEHWKRKGFYTFHDFCREHFSISKTKLYTLLKGMEVIAKLPEKLQSKITSDAQVLALSKIPEKDRENVIIKAENNGGLSADNLAFHSSTPGCKTNVTSVVTLTRVRVTPNSQSQALTNENLKKHTSQKDKIVVFDKVGTIVPDDALPYWNHRQLVQDVLTQISRLKSEINKTTEGVECLWSKHKQHGEEYLTRAYSYLSDALPYAVCLQCQGSFRLQPEGCSICGNTGFISEYRFDHYLPKELREIRMRSNEDLGKQYPESPLNKKPQS